MIDDQLPGHGPGDIRTEILFDHRQCEVDARRHPGRGPHRAVDDENAIFLHLHFWKPRLQFSRVVPMRRRATAVQQPCSASTNAPVQVEATRRDRCKPRRRNLITPGVKAPATALPPTIRVSKFLLSNGSVATLMPTELRMDPPVSDSRCTS